MALRKVMRRGEPRLFIDIRFRKKDGSRGRLRKDAQVQTLVAARAEEKRYLVAIAQHGEPYVAAGDAAAPVVPSRKSFAEVVDEFKSTFMITELKVTSRKGYEGVLDATLVPRFGGRGVDEVDGVAAGELDLEQSKRGNRPANYIPQRRARHRRCPRPGRVCRHSRGALAARQPSDVAR
ncbi:hypothetical protein, partial [Polyangium sorediatum]